eukprot:7932804-Alexandrium_andersonii.AAC.1
MLVTGNKGDGSTSVASVRMYPALILDAYLATNVPRTRPPQTQQKGSFGGAIFRDKPYSEK